MLTITLGLPQEEGTGLVSSRVLQIRSLDLQIRKLILALSVSMGQLRTE